MWSEDGFSVLFVFGRMPLKFLTLFNFVGTRNKRMKRKRISIKIVRLLFVSLRTLLLLLRLLTRVWGEPFLLTILSRFPLYTKVKYI